MTDVVQLAWWAFGGGKTDRFHAFRTILAADHSPAVNAMCQMGIHAMTIDERTLALEGILTLLGEPLGVPA